MECGEGITRSGYKRNLRSQMPDGPECWPLYIVLAHKAHRGRKQALCVAGLYSLCDRPHGNHIVTSSL
eukprot:scaffold27756_cov44-Phaeocystis_antarctica.AAC.2